MTNSTKRLIIISVVILLVVAVLSGILIHTLTQNDPLTSSEPQQDSLYSSSSIESNASKESSSVSTYSDANLSSSDVSSKTTSSKVTSSKTTSSKVTSSKVTSSKVTSSKVTSSKATSSKATSSKATSSEVTSSRNTLSSDLSSDNNSSEVTNNLYERIILATKDFNSKRIGYGFGHDVNDDNRPLLAIEQQQEFGKLGITTITDNMDTIYLTFDEGYEFGHTEDILNVLKAKKCKVTFFVTLGYVKSNSQLIERMIKDGHIIGNHSVNHYSMPSLSVEEMISEIMGLHEYMLEHYGYEMKLFRPPTGAYSEQSLEVARLLGYRTLEWSFAYRDWDEENQPEEETAFETLKQKTHGGAIFLLHAVSKTNAKILGNIIDNWRNEGYSVKPFPNISPNEEIPK